jgi:tetratricopeptide (TPR) repeat protein
MSKRTGLAGPRLEAKEPRRPQPMMVGLLILFFYLPNQARSRDSGSLFSKARAYQEREEWNLAEECYRQFLRQVPGSAAAHSNLGIVYVHEHKFEDAVHEYQAALKIDPTLSGVYLNLGIAYFQEGSYAGAAPVLEKFLASNPQNRQAQELLGLCDLELDKYEAAVRMLTPLRADGNLDVLVALSAAYVRLRRMAEAQAILREFLDSPQSNSAQVHFLMGQTYAGLNQFPQALQEFRAVSAANGDWPQIHLLLGATEATVGRYQEAEADLRVQLQTTPDNFKTLFTLGALMNKEERFHEAIPLLVKAHGLSSQNGQALVQLAEAYWKTGSRDEAWSAIRRAVELDPENGQAHYLYGQIARQRQDAATARHEFAIAASLSAKASQEDILRLSEESQRP